MRSVLRIISLLILIGCSPLQSDDFPEIKKVLCFNSVNGCPCYSDEAGKIEVTRLYQGEAVYVAQKPTGQLQRITSERGACFYPISFMIEMKYAKVLKPSSPEKDHTPLPLDQFIGKNWEKQVEDAQKVDLGRFWPTFYNLALEDYFPGPKVPVYSPEGRVVASASQDFLGQVTIQGSGMTSTGIRLQYASPMRFTVYNDTDWGHGAGLRHGILPYRTIAGHFPGICSILQNKVPGCTRQSIMGMLLYFPDIAEKKVKMQGGKNHDGYFCLTDTGDPYFIRKDRIDFFVGTHGGGNPYLPPKRQTNYLNEGGIHAIVPSDFRLWVGPNIRDRAICPDSQIPKDVFHPVAGECTYDYHAVAAAKSLRIVALFDKTTGQPKRCDTGRSF